MNQHPMVADRLFCFLFCLVCIAVGLMLGQIIRFTVANLQRKDHTPEMWIVEYDSYAGWIRVAEYPTPAQAYAHAKARGGLAEYRVRAERCPE